MANQHQITEEEAVRLLSSRNVAGMEMIYDRYASAIYGVLYRIIPNEAIAEDLLQHVFLKIWNSHAQLKDSKERLLPRVIQMARNAAIDKIKSREYAGAARSHTEDLANAGARIPATTTSPPATVPHATTRLNAEHREILDLMFFSGHTQIEVALKLHIPLSTVKTRARAAILALRKSLEPHGV